MKLILIRHGESDGNIKQGFISGRTDPAKLTLKGRSQIVRTAWNLKDQPIDHIYVSPVVRAQETAQILQTYFPPKPVTAEWLTELDHGIFEGHYWWEVIHKIPPSWRAKREDYSTPYPKGESLEMLIDRVWAGWEKLLAMHTGDETIVLISHQAVITAMHYFLQHGGPEKIKTKQDIARVLKFIHTVKLPNGGYIEASIKNGHTTELTETILFEPVAPSLESIRYFYVGTIDGHDTVTVESMEDTASTNEVFKVKDGETHIVKVLEKKDARANAHQARLYQYLNEHDIPTSHIRYFDNSRVFFADDIFVQDFVEGDVIKTCLLDHPNAVKHLLQDIFKTIEKIHALPVSEVQDFWTPPGDQQFRVWKPFMLSNINLTLHMLQESVFPAQAQAAIVASLEALKAYTVNESYRVSPIHGDVSSGNIIAYHDAGVCRLRRIIDFEWARLGDPLWDFAYYWGWLERDDAGAASYWMELLKEKMPDAMTQLEQYRILFHAWTVRDSEDYNDNPIRLRRGKKSEKLLQQIVLQI